MNAGGAAIDATAITAAVEQCRAPARVIVVAFARVRPRDLSRAAQVEIECGLPLVIAFDVTRTRVQ